MPAYLKVVDRFSADYTFAGLGPNPMDSPALQHAPNSQLLKTSVSLEVFDETLEINMGQQGLTCLLKYFQTMSIKLL